MAGRPAARVLDPVLHPLPPVLQPGPGSFNVIIGYRPAWRGVPAAAAAAINAAKKTSDAALKVAKAATTAASGTPAAPAAKAAEELAKTAALAAMGNMISGMSGGADIHMCATPLPLPPHGPGVVVDGSPTVLINGLPACRQGDTIVEALGPPNKIVMGQFNVLIGNSANPTAPTTKNSVLNLVSDAADDVANAINEAVEFATDEVANFLNPNVTTDLGIYVDAIVNMSPTLKAKINSLKADGWVILGIGGEGSEADMDAKVIVIDTDVSDEEQVNSLAHETGHATYERDPYVPMHGKTRKQFVDANVKSELKGEGEAKLVEFEVSEEIKANGGPEIPFSGESFNHRDYDKANNKYKAGGSRDQAREEIGDHFKTMEIAGGTEDLYGDYFAEGYENAYDQANPPKGKQK